MCMANNLSILISDQDRRAGFNFYLMVMIKKEVGISAQYMNVPVGSFDFRPCYSGKSMIMEQLRTIRWSG